MSNLLKLVSGANIYRVASVILELWPDGLDHRPTYRLVNDSRAFIDIDLVTSVPTNRVDPIHANDLNSMISATIQLE